MFAFIGNVLSFLFALTLLGLVAWYAKIALSFSSFKELHEELCVKGAGFVLFFLPTLGFYTLFSIGRVILKFVRIMRSVLGKAKEAADKKDGKSA